MKSITFGLHLWAYFGLFIFFYAVSSYEDDLHLIPAMPINEPDYQSVSTNNDFVRHAEVEMECKSLLSSASELTHERNKHFSIINEMSFSNGDWKQDFGGVPLVPFDGSRVFENISSSTERSYKHPSNVSYPLYLASFRIAHVDEDHKSTIAVNVSGVLSIEITSGSSTVFNSFSFTTTGGASSSTFQYWPGYSSLTIPFEGVYTESEENGGVRSLCLLGTASLPRHKPHGSLEKWEWLNGLAANSQQPIIASDKRILVNLHYPKTLSLTSRAIRGELRSLNQRTSPTFFDVVSLSSQLGFYSKYQFGSERLISKACNPHFSQDKLLQDNIKIYKGFRICQLLDQYASRQSFAVAPNWKCNSTDEYCSRLGPFQPKKNIRVTNGGFQNVMLLMQDIRCEADHINVTSAKVSAVFRVVAPSENGNLAMQRTGLDSTLSAEGIWNSDDGQLCMVGCLDSEELSCNSRVCLYFSVAFSITKRSILTGSISSISDGNTTSYFPLSFERVAHPWELQTGLLAPLVSYEYSKIKLAGAFLERNEPYDFNTMIKNSLLSYPKLQSSDSEESSFHYLAEDLCFNARILPNFPSSRSQMTESYVMMNIFTLGSIFMRSWYSENTSFVGGSDQAATKSQLTEKQLLVNVSAVLTLTGESYNNISLLFLEGLYNPVHGRIYAAGCRDVRASWKILFDSGDLEDGLDCLIEVKIEYPATTIRWLTNQAARISIVSKRNEDDPLHFSSVTFQTFPIIYKRQREDILTRKGVEGVLRILVLSLAISCILSQLSYIRGNTNSLPFISLTMLGVQAIGYGIPLIMGPESLFFKMKSESFTTASYNFVNDQFDRGIEYLVKILILAALLMMIRLFQKTWKSRDKLLRCTRAESGQVPKEKWVLLLCLGVHAFGFLVVLVTHANIASQKPDEMDRYADLNGNSGKWRKWGIELEEYAGLIQDFFLLPQVIGNLKWKLNCKPLREVYYVGITMVRILPHVYDLVTAPMFNPYSSDVYEFVNPRMDFYSRFGDIGIPVTAIFLVVVVYIQQRWNHQQFCSLLGLRVYERLPTVSFEAELVSGTNNPGLRNQLQKDEG